MFVNHRNINPSGGNPHSSKMVVSCHFGRFILQMTWDFQRTEKGYLKPLRDVKNVWVDKLSTQREKVRQNERKCP